MKHHLLRGPFEQSSCSVIAIALLLDISYARTYIVLRALGRLESFGVNLADIAWKLNLTPRPDLAGKSLARTLPHLDNGRYLIRVNGHCFTVIDGVIYDTVEQSGNTKVRMVYENSKVS